MARYLVTGGCGFIGSHLVDALLANGHEVTVLDYLSSGHRSNLPAKVPVIVGSVADADIVQQAMTGMDGCFHLAAVASVQRSSEAWAETHGINQTGTINVLEAAKTAGTKDCPLPVVFASSAAVYGDSDSFPLREEHAAHPISPYGADKLGSELHARAASRVFLSRVIGLRFFNVFGPRQDPSSPYSGVISIFVDRALSGQDIVIFGDGTQTRDFIYVSDVVDALVASMVKLDATREGGFSVYNVCRGKSVSINQLAQTILEQVPEAVAVKHDAPRQGDIHVSLGDPKNLHEDLGVVPQIALDEGLARTIRWVQEERIAQE